MNTENSKTSKPERFKLNLADKLNLEDPKKNKALANASIYYKQKNLTTTNLKFQLQLGMTLLIYQIVLIQFETFNITLNLSTTTKNTKR